MKNWILKGMASIVIALATLSSCQKEDSTEVEYFVDDAVYSLQEGASLGKLGCFELVFPVSILFPDQTTQEFNTYEELGMGIREWRHDNKGTPGRPEFVFPIDVIKSDGTTVTVNSKEDLIDLRSECPPRKGKGPRGHIGRGLKCFDLVFPLTLVLPDKSEVSVTSYQEIKAALKEYHIANPGRPASRPSLKFPFTVTLKEDGSSVTVNNPDDLKNLKEDCRDK